MPFLAYNTSVLVYMHRMVIHITKKAFMTVCTNRHEIRPGLRVIVIGQPHRLAVVSLWIVGHVLLLFTFLSFMTHAPAFI